MNAVRFSLLMIAMLFAASNNSGAQDASTLGAFSGEVVAEFLPDGRTLRLAKDLTYLDPDGLLWTAPAGTLSDGASIPRALWSVLGSPFDSQGRRAHIIHDYYTTTRSRDWRVLNKAFYFMLRADGMPETKAKLFYSAVSQFGPRWNSDGTTQPTPQATPQDVEKQLRAIIAQLQKENTALKQRRDDYGDTVKDANICTDGAPEDPTKRRARVWFLDKDNRCSPTYTNSYALVVGIGEYTPGGFWDPLPGALKDADAIAEALRSLHGFAVTSINNPTAEQLRNALAEFSSGPGQESDARIVVYYAGHGHTMGAAPRTGWLVPIDAPNPETDPGRFLTKAINIREALNWSETMQSKHVLWLFDSCFSGSIIEKLRGSASPNWRTFLRDGRVRRIITSGSMDQRVPDQSIFSKNLLLYLRGETRVVEQASFFTGHQLSIKLKEAVISERGKLQTPQLGTMSLFGDEEGDVVFQTVGRW